MMENLQGVSAGAKRAMSDGYEAARETAANYVDQGKQYLDQGRDKAREVADTMQNQVREQPMKAIAIAVAAGFVLGLVFARR
jgi:ElaB/YqjD/DUF883 family membrane-anchored ribosome-binding protein